MANRRTIYLIDSENTGEIWLKSVPKLQRRDRVYVFYTENSTKYAPPSVKRMIGYAKQLDFVRCTTGPNALDFQLVSWLGYLVRSFPKAKYCIVSNDHGYDAVCDFWEKRNVVVERKPWRKIESMTLPVERTDAVTATESEEKTQTTEAPTKPAAPTVANNPDIIRTASGQTFRRAYRVCDISPEAQKKIQGVLKKKYWSDENFVIVYNAIVSGKQKTINSAAAKIAANDVAAAGMKTLWPKYVNGFRKCAKPA